MNRLRKYLARGVLFVATILAIRSARRGDTEQCKKILTDSLACAHLPHFLRIRLATAVGWQEDLLNLKK
jgi:hypothetical protein